MQIPEKNLRSYILALKEEWPEFVDSLNEALNSVANNEPLSSTSIDSIKGALCSNRAGLVAVSMYLAADASAFDPRVLEVVLDLSRSTRAHERHNAILCLSTGTPITHTLDIIGRGLLDKSSKVRAKAADWIINLRLSQAAPLLEQAVAKEVHAETLRTMEYSLHLLRDGHYVYSVNDRHVGVTILTDQSHIRCNVFERNHVVQQGIDHIVAELRSQA